MKKSALLLLIALAFVPRPAAALQTDELLSLVAMPLAVAAVSELIGVPSESLFDFVALLNEADVPPIQFVEVVRYVPVALVEETDDRDIVQFVRTRTTEGVRGDQLALAIARELQTTYTLTDARIDVRAHRVIFTDSEFVPAVVRTRVAERRTHPHGGPPGQLKKTLGLKTGAEVVHGSKPGKDDSRARTVVRTEERRSSIPPARVVVESEKGRGKDRGKDHDGNSGKGKDHQKGKGKGKEKGR